MCRQLVQVVKSDWELAARGEIDLTLTGVLSTCVSDEIDLTLTGV